MRQALALLGAVAALAPTAAPLTAQTLRGTLVDELTDLPVRGADVRLVDRSGKARARAVTDSLGTFTLTADPPGDYHVRAEQLGYQPALSPLLDLTFEGMVQIELLISPEPVGLEGFSVQGRSTLDRDLRALGVSAPSLGNRLVTREEIDAVQTAFDVGGVLQWQNIAGITVIRGENTVAGSDDLGLCVAIPRARSMGGGRCMLTVLNGVPVSALIADQIHPRDMESIVVLLPTEAALLWGTAGAPGAVVIYTRRGGR